MSKVRFKQIDSSGFEIGQRFYYDGNLWVAKGYEGYASNETIQSTTSGAYQQAVRLTTPNIPAGRYEIFYQCSVNYTRLGWGTLFRVQVDDSTNIENDLFHSTQDTSSNQRYSISGGRNINLSAGIHTIDLDYRSEDGFSRSTIYSPRIFIRDADSTVNTLAPYSCKLKPKQLEDLGAVNNQQIRWDGTQFIPFGYSKQATSLGVSTTSSSTFQNKLTLTTDASMPLGDYIIFWHFTWYRQSTSGDSGFRVRQNSFTIQTWEQEPHDPSTDQDNTISGFYVARNISGIQNFDILFREINGSTTGIRDAYLNIQQILTR